jgi:signal-transduction protein with cAMP-binding, CBS, and nucleotidyltransferase domain
MAKQVRDLMSKKPVKLTSSSPIIEAARQMRAANVGAVIVEDGSQLKGIVTDRDIVVRGIAQGRDPATTPLSEVCSGDLTTLSPEDDIDSAVTAMRNKAIRRVLVTDQGKAVGILSLGDVAMEKDSGSALGQISGAAPNQ